MDLLTNPPKKILIINIFGIGDVLFTTPLISNLKYYFPQSTIGYLCNRRGKTVLENNPDIDQFFIYERDEFEAVKQKSRRAYVQKLWALVQEIKKERFDVVFDVSLTSAMSYLTYLAGIQNRIGFNYKNRSALLSEKLTLNAYQDKHVVEYYLELLEKVGLKVVKHDLNLYPADQDRQKAQEWFKKNNLDPKMTIVGVVPGGGASWGKEADYKRWPLEKYAKLADKIVENCNAQIILMGDVFERELCHKMTALMHQKAISFCGETTVLEMAALMNQCRLVIANDGGPLHIAVGAGARTLSIFGPVDFKVYGPYPPQKHSVVTKDLACQPCYRKFRRARCEHISCLRSLDVDEVFRKVKELL